MLFFLVSLGTAFLTVFYAYYYIRLYSEEWPQGGLPLPEIWRPAAIYALLPIAAVVHYISEKEFGQEKRNAFRFGLWAVCVLGVAFVVLQVYSLTQLEFTHRTNAYGSVFFTLSGVLDLTILTGLVFEASCLVRSWQVIDHWRMLLALHVQMNGMLWYFAAVVAVLAYATLYLSPHWI
ncbi:MAG: cytochrome c oxidase subunit 3 [Planctomycetes bacterium]|nr:cytochrome c oxidase subunit 3 [Planctomycetota bacterium]